MLIIPSGKPKIWDKNPDYGPTRAKYAYTGTFHCLAKTYAEMFSPDDYLILSPKYGFLYPEDWVKKTYDVRFTLNGVNQHTISLADLKKSWQEKTAQRKIAEIIMIGGKKYLPLMEQVLAAKIKISLPLAGSSGIGIMQQKLKKAIQEREPLADRTQNKQS
ncbi:DUF6884 domain-containing protein [Listeria sp. PSOL-1]|uniref:DUF6884 domain-containing protein n=1 Tax=Listeria sp. PSOL-1 TaxID=1844999 RepID=UPI0013D4C392|nr:DUF6884 domain-containing protein [Listeria sp. PSOL-1]